MICTVNTTLAGRPLNIKFWTLEHFKGYAQCLDKMPLAKYALSHLKYHINGFQKDKNVENIVTEFIHELANNPAIYLLGSCVSSYIRKISLDDKQSAIAKDFRNKVLRFAAQSGLPTVVEVLLMTGVEINAKNEQEQTALHLAVEGGHTAVVRLLMAEGEANINAMDENYQTALHLAAERGNAAIVRLLMAEGKADVHAKDVCGETALHRAAERGHEPSARWLIVEGKANVNEPNFYSETALSLAAKGGHEAVVRLLAEAKAKVNARDMSG